MQQYILVYNATNVIALVPYSGSGVINTNNSTLIDTYDNLQAFIAAQGLIPLPGQGVGAVLVSVTGTVTLANGTATITNKLITSSVVFVFSRIATSGTPANSPPIADTSTNHQAVISGAPGDNSTYKWIALLDVL